MTLPLKMLLRFRLNASLLSSSSSCSSSSSASLPSLDWNSLIQSADRYTPSEQDLTVLNGQRPWVIAQRVCLLSKPTFTYIQWINSPDKDIIIRGFNGDNMYTRHVKSVLYAIILALSHNTSHVIVECGNETVCKVASGRFKAGKEVKLFGAISKLTRPMEEVPCRAKVIDSCTPINTRNGVPSILEDEFREKYSRDLNWLMI